MKHVREELPDVQLRRPEVSSALAAVVDRATDEGPRPRATPTTAQLIADLEDVLGDRDRAHAARRPARRPRVLRTLPGRARGAACRCASRIRARLLAAARARRGRRGRRRARRCCGRPHASAAPGTRRALKAPPGLRRRSRSARARGARLRPARRRRRAPRPRPTRVVDRDPSSTWSTESYDGGDLAASPASGSTSTPSPASRARAIEIRTPTPRLARARSTPRRTAPPPDDARRRLEEGRRRSTTRRAPHARRRSTPPATRFRYYLSGSRSCRPSERAGRDLRGPRSSRVRSGSARSRSACALERDRARAGRPAPGRAGRSPPRASRRRSSR